jgi:hypothetical protein
MLTPAREEGVVPRIRGPVRRRAWRGGLTRWLRTRQNCIMRSSLFSPIDLRSHTDSASVVAWMVSLAIR